MCEDVRGIPHPALIGHPTPLGTGRGAGQGVLVEVSYARTSAQGGRTRRAEEVFDEMKGN